MSEENRGHAPKSSHNRLNNSVRIRKIGLVLFEVQNHNYRDHYVCCCGYASTCEMSVDGKGEDDSQGDLRSANLRNATSIPPIALKGKEKTLDECGGHRQKLCRRQKLIQGNGVNFRRRGGADTDRNLSGRTELNKCQEKNYCWKDDPFLDE